MKIREQQQLVVDHYFQRLIGDVADRMGWDHDIDDVVMTWYTINYDLLNGQEPATGYHGDVVISDPRMIGLYGLPYTVLLQSESGRAVPREYVWESKWLQPFIQQIILTNKFRKQVLTLRMKITHLTDTHDLCVSTKNEFECLPPSYKRRHVFIDVDRDGVVIDSNSLVAAAYIVYGPKPEWNLEAAFEVARLYYKLSQLTNS